LTAFIILNIIKVTLKPPFLPLSVGLECAYDLQFLCNGYFLKELIDNG